MSSPAVDPTAFEGYGNLLTERSKLVRLSRAYERDEVVADVLRQLQRGATRAVLLLGPSGAGKTAIVHELAHRLASDEWHLLELTGADFLRGTRYLGEWETRVAGLVELAKQPSRVILYLPHLESLSSVGKSSSTESNVADALAPYIMRGELAVIGESTDEMFRHGLGSNAALRRLFHVTTIECSSPETTRRILPRVVRDAGARTGPEVLERLLELSDYYGTPTELPGRAIDLLKRSLEVLQGNAIELQDQDVLSAIRKATGVPTELLDDRVKLDRAAVQAFFEARVMGQPEAVNAAVDFVMLIKAGLTDPQKPLGVLMFIGPTGVGKTELARALAEYCFGDAARLTRLDMTEYSTWEAPQKLLGANQQEGVLTAAVREQPFSIILMDEIEKAHSLVFDLCLQLFDAGRLTDGRGRTADFRRTLIVLTSNIGANIPQELPIGFQDSPDSAVVEFNLRKYAQREMHRFFRPEFLNRIDRVVHFAPLSQETAERIAQRELIQVLQRGGIRRRKLQVEIDPLVLPQLLREGYSQAFGARPLKRTIERMVLLPLARMIASGKAPPGAVIKIAVRGGVIKPRLMKVEEADESAIAMTDEPATAAIPRERIEHLRQQVQALGEYLPGLESQKQALMARANEQQTSGAIDDWRATNDDVFRLDGLVSHLKYFERSCHSLQESLRQRNLSRSYLARVPDLVEELELEARFLARAVPDTSPQNLRDAIVTLTLAESRGAALHGVEKLAGMLTRFATQQRLQVRVLDDRRHEQPLEDTATLLMEGAGAYLLLASETGRHILQQGRDQDAKRETIRVQVLPVPPHLATPDRSELRTEIRRLRGEGERLVRRRLEVKLYHAASMISLRAWTDCPRERALALVLPWLAARIDESERLDEDAIYAEDQVVRRYRLGPGELVRDARTGQRWGRLDRVLDGALHRFLLR